MARKIHVEYGTCYFIIFEEASTDQLQDTDSSVIFKTASTDQGEGESSGASITIHLRLPCRTHRGKLFLTAR